MKRGQTCGTCRHCLNEQDVTKPLAKDAKQGVCRGAPPSVVAVAGGVQFSFPIVPLDWFCGAWQRKVA